MTEEFPVINGNGENEIVHEQVPTGPVSQPDASAMHSPDSTQPRAEGNGHKHARVSLRAQQRTNQFVPANITREEAIQRLEALHRLARLISQSNHNIKKLTQSVARMASEMIGDMCVIGLVNHDGKSYHAAAHHDADPAVVTLFGKALDELDHIPLNQGFASRVLASGEPLLVQGISLEEVLSSAVPGITEFVRQVGVASMLIVPLRGRSGTLGALALTRHRGGRPYTAQDQALLMEIGRRVGVAIEDFTHIESLRQELSMRIFSGEALAASEERFLSIFRSAASGIKVMDLVGTILEANPAFQFMTGYSEAELVSMHFYDIVHPNDLAAVLDTFNKLKTGRQPYARQEHRLLCKDGSIVWVNTTYAGVKKGPGHAALSLIFGIAENITERKQAETDLLEFKQHLQRSIELERLRIAQRLHDAPLQELYAVVYKLEDLRLRSDPGASEALRESIADIKKTLQSLRATASELRPPALSRFGLEKAIRSYAEDFKTNHPNIQLKLTLAHDKQLLSEHVRLVLFRVFQEALSNAARHSQATEVQVRFSFDAEEARIEISDNGKGFGVPSSWMSEVRMGHYGLAGMAERVSAASGMLVIESGPESSTTVRAVVPTDHANG